MPELPEVEVTRRKIAPHLVGRRIAEYDITWYEEPLSPMDLDGLAVIRESTGIPIATGENEYTRWGFREMFSKGGVDVAMPDMARTGGITEMRKICAVATTHLAETERPARASTWDRARAWSPASARFLPRRTSSAAAPA